MGKNLKDTNNKVYQGKNYRITILSESLIRFEYNVSGTFLDSPTEFAINRNFPDISIKVDEDEKFLEIESSQFALLYEKEKPFIGPKYAPDANLKVVIPGTNKVWYYNHPEAKNYKTIGEEIYSASPSKSSLVKGLYSLDGMASIDDSASFIIMEDGSLRKLDNKRIDIYLFVYNNNFDLCLKDYFTLSGPSPLIPRYALGIWWNRDKIYSFDNIKMLIKAFNRYRIPMSVLLLSEFWHLKNPKDYTMYKTGYTFDKGLFPNPTEFTDYMHKRGIRVGININQEEGIYSHEENYKAISTSLGITDGSTIPFNAYDPKFMDTYLKLLINPIFQNGVDFLWIDYHRNHETLKLINYYHQKNNLPNSNFRNMLLTRNNMIAPHRYPITYSGETVVNWESLNYLPTYNILASNMGIGWISHDVGGYKDGIEDSELYTRHVQFATFSPIFRFSAQRGLYYKREPWLWDNNTYNIVKDYCNLRHRLIPYLYTANYEYHHNYKNIIRPLYLTVPDLIDEPLYKNEYYFGSELLVAPITSPKDMNMNRAIQKLYLPKGIWYDFQTGKKFIGDKRYVTFFKDENYPVFAKAGAIIPLANLEENLNVTSNPNSLEIIIFPGENNTYNLYEDDGITNNYKDGYFTITSFEYKYARDNYTLNIRPISGKIGILPPKREYIIRFKNTKSTTNIDVFCESVSNKLLYESTTIDNDLVIVLKDVDTSKNISINVHGHDIEIEASRIINEDVNFIISDLKIKTKLKEKISLIFFGKEEIKKKRIAIKKLEKDGLEKNYVKMFLRLLDYVSEI